MSGCGCGCASKKSELNDEQVAILKAVAKIDGPCTGKQVAEELGVESKAVTSKISALKKKGYLDSPARCRHGITDAGREAINC